jgi:hypothetical protein
MRRADNLTTFMCRLSRNLGASTSWNPKGLSRPVMGLFFFCRPRTCKVMGAHLNPGSFAGYTGYLILGPKG